MDRSRHIISINTGPNADMVEASDVIVVEDFRKVVPMLIEELGLAQKNNANPKTQRRLSWQT